MRTWLLSTSDMVYESSAHAASACRHRNDFRLPPSQKPKAALALKHAIDRAVELLERFPHAGPTIDRAPEFRGLRIGRFPYRIYYRVRDNEVWIVHVRHVRRRPWEGE